MKKALILYNSKTGTTKKYAQQIAEYLETKKIEPGISSIQEYSVEMLDNADYLLLGCWTSGLMLFLQHPEKVWKDFAAKLPKSLKSKTAFFTTYKLLTGSMFKNMLKELDGKTTLPVTELKSRNGNLSVGDKAALDTFIG
jgi:flavodoxin